MRIISFCLLLTLAPLHAIPQPGESIADETFALSPATNGAVLSNLTNETFASFEGKVVLVAYFTPW